MHFRAALSGLVLLATLIAIGYAVEHGLSGMLDEHWIDGSIRGHGVAGVALFVGTSALATATGVPRQVVSFLGGYAFGAVAGTLIALGGTEAGCILAFGYARLIGRPLVRHRLGARAERLERILISHPFAMTLVVRLLPVGHNLTTTLAAGVSRIQTAPFLAGSLIGYLPQTLVFALAGSGVGLDAKPRIALAAALFIASAALGAWLYRRYRKDLSKE